MNKYSKITTALRKLNNIDRPPATRSITKNPRQRNDLTTEQETALKNTAKKLKIQAFAGTGKTTLLQEFSHQAFKARGLYLAYNKSIVTSARHLFPDHIDCLTQNALALKQLGSFDPNWRNFPSGKLAELTLSHLQAYQKNGLNLEWVMESISRFIQSPENEIQPQHFPMDHAFFLSNGQHDVNIKLHIEIARSVWAQMSNAQNPMPMSHEGYLKLWSLSPKPLPYDYILIDESQDSNPAFLSGMAQQDCRQIFVGDEHQGIYSFRGAVNALRLLSDCEALALTYTHRFGPAISHLANSLIERKGSDVFIKSSPKTYDTALLFGPAPLGIPPLYLARTNAGLFDKALRLSEQRKNFKMTGSQASLHFDDLEDLLLLSQGGKSQGKYSTFSNLDELIEKSQKNGKNDLALRAKLVKKHGTTLPEKLQQINAQAKPQTFEDPNIPTLSTVHQAKGLESEWVELLNDFPSPPMLSTLSASELTPKELEEINILYVGITRAKKGLSIPEGHLHKWAYDNRLHTKPKEDDINIFGSHHLS